MSEVTYDAEEDVLNIELNEGTYWKSVELPPDIVIDISRDGKILSIEIIKASKVFSGDNRKVIEAVKASA